MRLKHESEFCREFEVAGVSVSERPTYVEVAGVSASERPTYVDINVMRVQIKTGTVGGYWKLDFWRRPIELSKSK